MNETEFQVLFDSYQQALRSGAENPIPQKLHLLVYNYARLRHQQSSDVSADFYLHVAGKLDGIFARYDSRRLPFYQYLAATLNFEFSHFLRRRRLPRSQIELLSVEELASRRVELQYKDSATADPLAVLMSGLKPPTSIYARLSLACPLTYGELRHLALRRKGKGHEAGWQMLRSYRAFLRHIEEKRQVFTRERDKLIRTMMKIEDSERSARPSELAQWQKKRENARKKFFSMDTRIPIRILAEVTGDSIATAQRQLKRATETLKSVYVRWEKQNGLET